MEEQWPEFEYSGRLVFNGLSHLAEIDKKTDLREIYSKLPHYESGTPFEPGEGFNLINFTDFPEYRDLNPELTQHADSMLHFVYKREKYTEEQMVNSDGETEQVFTKDLDTVDIFLTKSGHMMFMGAKNIVKQAQDKVHAILVDQMPIEELELQSDFLVWLFYKHQQKQNISERLRTDRLTDAKVSGEADVFGSTRRISGSTDLLRSPPIITALLQNESLETIGGDFVCLGNYHISSDISKNGRIHIKSRGEIQHSSDLRRVVLSSLFVNEVLDAYDTWLKMEPKQKYPPEEFFTRLYTRLEELSVSLEFPLDRVIENYKQKREEL